MKASLIQIGNSRGIRLPKSVIEACHFKDEVELEVSSGQVTIRLATLPREGWNEAFKTMTQSKDDQLLDSSSPSKFDKDEWEWK